MRRLGTLYLLGSVLIPGYFTLSGPDKVMYYEGESLSVRCHYEKHLQENTKFWCKGSVLTLCSGSLIKSSGSLVKKDRVSIRDNKEECYFEITMDKLEQTDSDFYQCGIERGIYNDRHYIQVSVSPDPKKTPGTPEEGLMSIAPTAGAKSTPSPASEPSKDQQVYLLIYCIIPLFLLLLTAAVVLFMMARKKKKGLCWKRKKEKQPQNMVLAHNTAEVRSEPSIPDRHQGHDGTDLYGNVEVHPGNNYKELLSQEKSPDKKDEVFYTMLNVPDPQQQQPIYANVDAVLGPALSETEEVFYTEVAKKSKE